MPENSLRFSVFSMEHRTRGASWKLWTPQGKRDVYLAGRELRGAIKLSLHESGNWHFAYDHNFFEAKVPKAQHGSKGRFIDKWARPEPIAPGITLALRIVTPWTALKPRDLPGANVFQIPAPPESRAQEVYVLLMELPSQVSSWPGKNKMGTTLIGTYSLSPDSSIWAVYKEIGCPDFSGIPSMSGTLFNDVPRTDISSDLRAMAYGDNADGSKVIYDLAVKYDAGAKQGC